MRPSHAAPASGRAPRARGRNYAVIPIRLAAPQSLLRLAASLGYGQGDAEQFAAAAIAAAADRCRAEVIEPDRDPHVRVGRRDAVRRVEAHPAELGHERLGPGVPGVLLHT